MIGRDFAINLKTFYAVLPRGKYETTSIYAFPLFTFNVALRNVVRSFL